MITKEQFDKADVAGKRKILYQCCPSEAWVRDMIPVFPVGSLHDLLEHAEEKWYDCNPAEWQETFLTPCPQRETLETQEHISFEGNSESTADENLALLAEAKAEYEETFGFPYILFTPGMSQQDQLITIRERLHHSVQEELEVAAREQLRITCYLLKKIFG